MIRDFWLISVMLVVLSAPFCKAQDNLREYEGPGNFFIGADLGTSLSLAENSDAGDVLKTLPTLGGTLGYHFTPIWSLRLHALITSQKGHPSDDAIAVDPELYKPYNFFALVGSMDVMLNVTNCFRHYDTRNIFDCYLLAGGGQLYTFGFADHVKEFDRSVYFVDPNSYRHWQFKIGTECAWHLSRSFDLKAEFDFFLAKNKYNGVIGSSSTFDPFLSFRMGATYYLPNKKDRHRFANPRVLHLYWKELN